MNMLLHGVKDAEFDIFHGDTLLNEWNMMREANPAKKPSFDASYLLQGSDNLSTWIPLQTFTTSGTGAASLNDTTARGPRYFYRAVPVVSP